MATDLDSAIFYLLWFLRLPWGYLQVRATSVDNESPQQSQETPPTGYFLMREQHKSVNKLQVRNYTLGCEPTPSGLLGNSVSYFAMFGAEDIKSPATQRAMAIWITLKVFGWV